MIGQSPDFSVRRPKEFIYTRYAGLAISLVLLLVVASCRSRAAEQPAAQWGHETLLAENAALICGQECLDRGQCGDALDRGLRMVLLHTWGPATTGHDLAIPENTRAAIATFSQEAVVEVMTGQEFLVNYYLVQTPDGPTGWVAGWCLRTP